MRPSLLFPLLLMVCPIPADPHQHNHQHEHQRQGPERLGKVDFHVACSPSVQEEFQRAVALLHSFQYEDSERAFTSVASSDPQCAMAYWGIAMSLYHPIWAAANPSAAPSRAELERGRAAVEKAKSIGGKTERERDYISAIEAFYKDSDKIEHRTRAIAYEKAMERVHALHPRDKEAGIFYALALLGNALPTDKSYTLQNKAASILNAILPTTPEHPGVAHYLIHSFDYPDLAHFALHAARSYSKIAPSSAHALHMPSHIFTRLGLWNESVRSNLDSAAAARAQVAKTHPGATHYDELHAMDYLVYAYMQNAQDGKAQEVLSRMRSVKKVDQVNFAAAFAFAAAPARFVMERRKWSDAAGLDLFPPDFPWEQFTYAAANIHFARAVGAARSGALDGATKSIEKLESIEKALGAARVTYWSDQVRVQRMAAESWLAFTEKRHDDAMRLMRAAADLEDSMDKHPVTPGPVLPARELLADLLAALDQPAAALKEYEASLKANRGRFNGLLGAARAASKSGDVAKARKFYTQLSQQCQQSGAGRAELGEAREFLKGNRSRLQR